MLGKKACLHNNNNYNSHNLYNNSKLKVHKQSLQKRNYKMKAILIHNNDEIFLKKDKLKIIFFFCVFINLNIKFLFS